MASAGPGGSLPPNFLLTPQQQSLLFAALNSNKQQSSAQGASNAVSAFSPNSLKSSPMQTAGTEGSGYNQSPFLDNYDYDFGDSSFDFSFNDGEQARMIGDMPDNAKSERSDSAENDALEKRSHPDDDDDEDSPEQDPKRRESTEKVPKKPGRKPLTSEPSSKRKAQNRAAQRAFRERKERHLKDLETKVDELEKASEAANHENSVLRAQVERMTTELIQYKQKVTVMGRPSSAPKEKMGFSKPAIGNLSDVNFQFEFPKFGVLPGPPIDNSNKAQRSTSQPMSPQKAQAPSPARSQSNDNKSPQQTKQAARDSQFREDLAKFSGVYTPSMTSSNANGSRASVDSAGYSISGGATSSPSASSNSNMGPSSSCGTSPEPFTQSPVSYKPVDTLTTIGEELPPVSIKTDAQPFAQFANTNFSNSNFDWLAQQNGGQFEPQLFGEYREPQENVLSNPGFDDFFNDALDADFFTPYNAAPSPAVKKTNLIDEIDAQQNSTDEDPQRTQNMNCNQIWDKLQACPNAQSGDFDLDGLCSELTKKAKCSGSGPVVGETDFDTILKKYMGKDVSTSCVANKLGIAVTQDKPLGVGMP